MLTKRATAYNISSLQIVFLIYRHLFRRKSLSKCAPQPKNRSNDHYNHYFEDS